jgi:hypothetical protein
MNMISSSIKGVGIPLYNPYEVTDWESLALSFIMELQKSWPNNVKFKDGGGNIISIMDTNLKTKLISEESITPNNALK